MSGGQARTPGDIDNCFLKQSWQCGITSSRRRLSVLPVSTFVAVIARRVEDHYFNLSTSTLRVRRAGAKDRRGPSSYDAALAAQILSPQRETHQLIILQGKGLLQSSLLNNPGIVP
ncbi:hypothetical protein E4U24_003890 [Claviceps purpurea]|nr:hypothetical protein E4U24_003890 [Claviceps purpurea]